MYVLGHFAFAYLLFYLTVKCDKSPIFLSALLISSILPDFDIIFQGFGIVHGSISHSFMFIVIISLVMYFFYKNSVPLILSLLSHLFLDMLVGPVKFFYPFSSLSFSLNFGMSSFFDALFEFIFLLFMFLIMWKNSYFLEILNGDKNNTAFIIPLIPLIGSMLIASIRFNVWRLDLFSLYNPSMVSLGIIVFGHLILSIILTISIMKSFLKS